ncbi:MAG: CDP-glycerol glycerophosphotransferase family protein [Dehalococcoidia bacterium]
MTNRILLSLQNGWAVRNIFYTGIADQLAQTCEVVILVPQYFHARILGKVRTKNIIVEAIEARAEPTNWRLLRQLRKKVFLEVTHNETEKIKMRAESRKVYQRIGGVIVHNICKLTKGANLISITEAIDFSVNKDTLFASLLEKYHPGLVVGNSPFVYTEESLMRASMKAGIPCICFVPSWDNVSKGIINQRFQRVLVWNEVLRDEILGGYPNYHHEKVKVVGVPQFDIYNLPPAIEYAAWCRQFGLNPAHRTILYSTEPQVRFSYDPVIVERILEGIKSGRLPEDVQVLIRCHPFDDAGRYKHLLGKYNVGIFSSSRDPGEFDIQWLPPQDELSRLRDCLVFSSLNINVASTMSIDTAACGKPIVNIAFDGDAILPYERSSRRIYDYAHYKRVVATGAVRVCSSYDELFQGIIDYLNNPQLDADKRSALVDMMCTFKDGKSAQRCVTELLNCIE